MVLPGEVQKLLLIGPQHRLVVLYLRLRHEVVQVGNYIFGMLIANDNEEASLLLDHAILNEGADSGVTAGMN